MISTIESARKREGELFKLARVLIEAQQWEQARTLIGSIEISEVRASALTLLVTDLVNASKREMALHLLQLSWLEARTREFAINSLAMADKFIQLMPQIGLAFYDSFTWVETFLKG